MSSRRACQPASLLRLLFTIGKPAPSWAEQPAAGVSFHAKVVRS